MSEEEIKEEVKEEVAEVVEVKEEEVSAKSADEIQALLEAKPEEPKEEVKEEVKEETKEEPKEEKEEEWYDKARGFKTKDDADRSYVEAQNKIREQAEELKAMKLAQEMVEKQKPLSPEDVERQKAIDEWKEQNKEGLEFVKNEVKKELAQENQKNSFQEDALKARNTWKQEFDKDEARKALWPKMEEYYAKKGDGIFKEFVQNPFPYIEAMAFKNDFASIAETIRAEAVEQYKASIKEADEVERQKLTQRPGGTKSVAGDVDVSKMSADEIGKLITRSE